MADTKIPQNCRNPLRRDEQGRPLRQWPLKLCRYKLQLQSNISAVGQMGWKVTPDFLAGLFPPSPGSQRRLSCHPSAPARPLALRPAGPAVPPKIYDLHSWQDLAAYLPHRSPRGPLFRYTTQGRDLDLVSLLTGLKVLLVRLCPLSRSSAHPGHPGFRPRRRFLGHNVSPRGVSELFLPSGILI